MDQKRFVKELEDSELLTAEEKNDIFCSFVLPERYCLFNFEGFLNIPMSIKKVPWLFQAIIKKRQTFVEHS